MLPPAMPSLITSREPVRLKARRREQELSDRARAEAQAPLRGDDSIEAALQRFLEAL